MVAAHRGALGVQAGGEKMAYVQDRWLSVEETCQHLGVSSDIVYRWIHRSAMPAQNMGRKWKFKRDQVDAWGEAGGAAGDSHEEATESGVE